MSSQKLSLSFMVKKMFYLCREKALFCCIWGPGPTGIQTFYDAFFPPSYYLDLFIKAINVKSLSADKFGFRNIKICLGIWCLFAYLVFGVCLRISPAQSQELKVENIYFHNLEIFLKKKKYII